MTEFDLTPNEDNHPRGFLHCEVAILTGRPLELRKAIGDGISGVLRRRFAASLESGDAGFKVEVREMDREMDRETYVK